MRSWPSLSYANSIWTPSNVDTDRRQHPRDEAHLTRSERVYWKVSGTSERRGTEKSGYYISTLKLSSSVPCEVLIHNKPIPMAAHSVHCWQFTRVFSLPPSVRSGVPSGGHTLSTHLPTHFSRANMPIMRAIVHERRAAGRKRPNNRVACIQN